MEKRKNIILVPTDFSEVCFNAIKHGAEIAKTHRAQLCVLHVINRDTKTFLKREKLNTDYVNKKLEEIKKEIKKTHFVDVIPIAKEGSIFSMIEKVNKEIGAQLVVLGTHGKIGMQKLTGSYALRVVMNSSVPVIVVQEKEFGKGYKNIVFPLSKYSEDRQKVDWAVFIAKKFHAKVHIFKENDENLPSLSRFKVVINQIKESFEKHFVRYEEIAANKKDNFVKQVFNYVNDKNIDLIMIMTKPDNISPTHILNPDDEKFMFNADQTPVMCINPRQLNLEFYDF